MAGFKISLALIRERVPNMIAGAEIVQDNDVDTTNENVKTMLAWGRDVVGARGA